MKIVKLKLHAIFPSSQWAECALEYECLLEEDETAWSRISEFGIQC